DHHALGEPGHGPHAVEVAEHLAVLAVERRLHLLGVVVEGVAVLERLELFEAGQAAANGAEVGEGASQPAIADEGHAAPGAFTLDGFGGLLLGADELDKAALRSDLGEVLASADQAADGFADVDDV